MLVEPKVRGFICTAAHPMGCSENVLEQKNYVSAEGSFSGPKNALIIGASTGYGLASRIALAFGSGTNTLGVSYERPSDDKRTASPGWYNTATFEKMANKMGVAAKSINGDAFSNAVKEKTFGVLKEFGPIDIIIYSLAAPKRIHPVTGEIFSSVLKPIGQPYQSKTLDPMSGVVKEVTIEPATPEEIRATEAVMGGEDWEMWIQQLLDAKLLAKNVVTIAYSYIGPEITHPIYKEGTIGHAKMNLHRSAHKINEMLFPLNGRALISVNKALVTQASSAIPVVPLYISILYKIMKGKGMHEGCIEQMVRLFKQKLYVNGGPILDAQGYIRMDDWEMDPKVQQEVLELWKKINNENLNMLTDIKGYREDFFRLFGFGLSGIDYMADVDTHVGIPSIEEN